MGTLRLGKPEMPSSVKAPEHGPELDRTKHFGEVCGVEGVRYVQGKALFSNIGRYVGVAPKEMELAPLTAKQETERQQKIRDNKKFFSATTPKAREAAVPQAILDAEKENRKALAAESRAA